MLGRIALFELRYQLRRPIAWFSALIFTGLTFGILSLGAPSSAAFAVNTPFRIAAMISSIGILAMLVSIAKLANVALRDLNTRMDEIVRATPVRPTCYLATKLAGAYIVAWLPLIGATIGIEAAVHMPWMAQGLAGTFRPTGHLFAIGAIALPTLFATGALFFAVATLTRSMLATYLSALALFALFVVAQILFENPSYRMLAALLDPFGTIALRADTAYWTNSELNSRLIHLRGALLWNRLIWTGIGAALLALSFALLGRDWQFRSPGTEGARPTGPIARRERPVIAVGGAGSFEQLIQRTRYEFRSIVRSWIYCALLILGVAACATALIITDRTAASPNLPVTYAVVDTVSVSFGLVAMLVIIVYGGEIVWRDRYAKIDAIIDATPTQSYVFLSSKIAAITLAMLPLLAAFTAVGVGYQVVKGGTSVDIGFYLVKLVWYTGSFAVMLGVLTIFIQTVVNRKFVGLLIAFAALSVLVYAETTIDNNLVVPFAIPDFQLSDMNRYGHYLPRTLWFTVYWSCVTLLIAVAAHLLWIRGSDGLRMRIRMAPRALTRVVASVSVLALAGTAATGRYIYWNTHVLNEFATKTDLERIQVDYEKAYRAAEGRPQPRIVQVDMEVDLFPDQRGFRSRGRYVLINQSGQPIDLVHLMFATGKVERIELEDAELADHNLRFNVFEFRPRTPVAPGERRVLTFALSDSHPGFQDGADQTPVVDNGSFVHSQHLAPTIGVQRQSFLQDDTRRKAYGLEPLPAMAGRDNQTELHRNFLSPDSDYVSFAMTVSTAADQIALAPGDLEREWTEGGRRYFRYKLAQTAVNFWSVVSARYAVTRDTWNEVEIAVYHDAKHSANVPRMLNGMKWALAYYTANFGPFPHRQLSIAEFPRYATFAQSFPTLIPYSEAVGFIHDMRNAAIDQVWHITAHEVAHQWWGHQVVGANVEGAQFLSESISEYSALMVAEQRYGAHKMRQFLKHELDTYLRARGQTGNERPLARAPMTQSHVHYQKGALAFYALKDALGEAALNQTLARFLRAHAYRSQPYPTSLDLLAMLRAEVGPDHDQLITDLFDKITLWDLRVTGSEATETPDGKWLVRVEVSARKLDSTPNGQERDVPLDQLIDVGLFDTSPDQASFGDRDVIALEKRRIKSGAQTLEFVVGRKPDFVGVDPYVKLISRNTAGNVAPLGHKSGGS